MALRRRTASAQPGRAAGRTAWLTRPGEMRRVLALVLVVVVSASGVLLPPSLAQAAGSGSATVTFDANGGDGTMPPQVAPAPTALEPNTFTRASFRFDGWATEANGGGTRFADGDEYSFAADVTLFAQWVALGFVVTFNANEGDGSMPAQVATTPTALNPNVFTREGRDFLGWNTRADGEGDEYADEKEFPFTASGTQALFAQWSDAPSRTVTFLPNEGVGTMPTQSDNQTSVLNANTFTREGHVFAGWNTEADDTGDPYGNGATYDFLEDVTLHAQWTQVQAFSVTFNANGGVGTMETQSSAVEAPLTPNEFTRSGFAFAGWSTAPDDELAYEDGGSYDFSADITLFARWLPGVRVTFDANGGQGSMADQDLASGTVLRANAFTRDGFVFSGWNTESDGSEDAYPNGWAGDVLPPTGTTLFAQWVEATGGATVLFNANGGSDGTEPMLPQQSETAAPLTENSFEPPEGRSFIAWNTKANGTGTAYADTAEFAFGEDTVLYAQWGFEVSLRPNGAPGGSIVVVIPSPGSIPDNPFDRGADFAFVGWTRTRAVPESNTSWHSPGGAIALSDSITLHAQWAPVTAGQRAVALVANRGFSATNDYLVTQASSGEANLIPNPYTRAGRTFAGWSTTSTNQTVAYADQSPYPFASDGLLYAVWSDNTATFDPNGGSGGLRTQTSRRAGPLAPRGGNPSRAGHQLTGWNTAPDGTGQAFGRSATYPFNLPEQNVYLYAQWEETSADPKSRSVTFEANAATAGFMPLQQSAASGTLAPNTFTRQGYRFIGWNTQVDGAGTAYADGAAWDFSEDLILHAQWAPLITFLPNGGAEPATTQLIDTASPTFEPNPFTRAGHAFRGWGIASTAAHPTYVDGQQLFDRPTRNSGELTLHAIWQPVNAGQHVVNYWSEFDHRDRPRPRARTQVRSTPGALSDGGLTRDGHTLVGWATSNGGTVEYAPGAQYDFDADLVLYAIWEQNTVVFDANGGTGTMAAQSDISEASLATNAFARTGFAFDGWAVTPTGPLVYSDGGAFPFDGRNQSVTLFARWVAQPGFEAVNFDANAGAGTMPIQTVQTGGTLTLAPNAFARAGFTFTGWADVADPAGGTDGDPVALFDDGQTVTVPSGGLTLYAQWVDDGSIVARTVTFDANRASADGSGTMSGQTVNGRTTLASNAFTRDGAVFTGWNTEPGGGGTGYADDSQVFTLADLTLYAQWLVLGAGAVAVEFRANGGSGAPITPLVGPEGSVVTLPEGAFSRPGFVFAGWNTEASGLGTTLAPGDRLTLGAESSELFAEWERAWFDVTFETNGGTGSMDVQSSDRATNLTRNEFSKARHTFAGWNTAQDGDGDAFADGASFDFDEDVTLYAQWTQTSFTVTFDGNGATGGAMSSQTASGDVSLAANAFIRSGHRFVGWSSDPSTTAATFSSDDDHLNGSVFRFDTDVDLYAVWQEVFTVTFASNGGEGSMATQSATEPTALASSTFTRSGHTFLGWNTQADGDGTAYADGASFPFDTNATLHAQWEPTTYLVTFNRNGGTGTMSAQSAAGSTLLNVSTFERDGYAFRGWSTSATATAPSFLDRAVFPFTAHTTLFAVWAQTRFTVTFDANGGTGTMAAQAAESPEPLAPNAFVRASHQFAGWATSATATQPDHTGDASFPFTADTTLYAVWAPERTVTYNANGGSGTMTLTRSAFPRALRSNTFALDRHTFVGWNTQSDGNGSAFADRATYPFAASVTLYAQWVQTTFTVTFDPNGASGTSTQQSADVASPLAPQPYSNPGFAFLGWATDGAATVAELEDGAVFAFDADVTLFAVWAPLFTVTFDANGGTGSMLEQVRSAPGPLRASTFVRAGFAFVGWATDGAATVAELEDGAVFAFDADVTLFAVWAPLFTVTFDANGGTGAMEPLEARGPIPVPASGFTRVDHRFVGWASDPTGEVDHAADDMLTVTADMTLFAVWEQLPPAPVDVPTDSTSAPEGSPAAPDASGDAPAEQPDPLGESGGPSQPAMEAAPGDEQDAAPDAAPDAAEDGPRDAVLEPPAGDDGPGAAVEDGAVPEQADPPGSVPDGQGSDGGAPILPAALLLLGGAGAALVASRPTVGA